MGSCPKPASPFELFHAVLAGGHLKCAVELDANTVSSGGEEASCQGVVLKLLPSISACRLCCRSVFL